jgi:hypothetical protein
MRNRQHFNRSFRNVITLSKKVSFSKRHETRLMANNLNIEFIDKLPDNVAQHI